jgi:hypothetical protein
VLTHDDLLDFHHLLEGDSESWFGELEAMVDDHQALS